VRHIRLLNSAIVLVLLAGLTASCKPAPPEPVKIAILGPLSGNVKPFGEANRDGALLAIEEWNAKGGVLGLPIEAVVEDSKCDAQAARDVATKVIKQDGVGFIIGGVCSSESIPISEIANVKGVLQISPSSSHPQVTVDEEGRNKPYSFRAVPLDAFMSEVMAAFTIEELGGDTAGVLYNEDSDSATHLAEFFRDAFTGRGGFVPVFAPLGHNQTDFSDVLTEVMETECDVLFAPHDYPDPVLIAKQAKEKGVRATMLGSDYWDVPDWDLDLRAVDGSYYFSLYPTEVTLMQGKEHSRPLDPRDLVQHFTAAYEEKYGTQPDPIAALAYDAANILLQAIAEAGTADPGQVKDVMMGLRFEGVTGGGTFDEFGDPIKEVAIVRVEGGRRIFHGFVMP